MQQEIYWTTLGIWLVWDLYWSISARKVKAAATKEPAASRAFHLALLASAFFLLLLPFSPQNPLSTRFLPPLGPMAFLGLGLQVLSLGLALWARRALGRNWSGRVTIKEDHELVTHGPYRWLRHPIYTGAIAAAVGSTLALGRVSGLLAIPLFMLLFTRKIRIEEQFLSQHFGERYTEYRRHTYALVPPIW